MHLRSARLFRGEMSAAQRQRRTSGRSDVVRHLPATVLWFWLVRCLRHLTVRAGPAEWPLASAPAAAGRHPLAVGWPWAVAAMALAACGEPAPAAPAPADAASKADSSAATASVLKPSTSLWLDLSGPAPALRRDKAEIFTLAGAQGVGFRQGVATVTHAFGSFKFDEPAQPPWQAVTSWKVMADLPDAATLSGLGADGKALATLAISRTGGALRLRVSAATAFNRATVAWPCAVGEHFLGLGGQSFDVDHRGHRVALWVEEDGIGKFPEQEAPPVWFLHGKRHQTHTPMPILVSSRGYAVVLRSDHRVVVDLCKTEPDLLRWENWHDEIDLTVIAKTDPLELQAALAKELGTPKVLPGFALLAWGDAIYGSANVRRIASKFKAGGYPVSVLWSEDWRGGTKTGDDYTLDEDWKADAALYPDLPQLAKDLHGQGYKFLLYNNTFLTSDGDIFAEAKKNVYGVRNPDGSLYTFNGSKLVPASLLDLWNPAARQWAKDVYETGLQAGADGWMADFCEWLPTDAVMADGTLGLDRHQQYAVECQRLNRELFDQWHAKDGVERLFFVRSAWLGSQSEVSVVWAGDQQTDFSQGDGLHSVIPIGIGLGMTGFPYYGSDIAGYASTGTDFTTKELFFRWTTLGALSPVMRTHHGKFAQANWQWEHDADTEAHFLRYTQLHAALWPYLWALANRPELPRGHKNGAGARSCASSTAAGAAWHTPFGVAAPSPPRAAFAGCSRLFTPWPRWPRHPGRLTGRQEG